MASDGLDEFAAHRRVLFAVAYRMLGSAADADDAVQDAWLRWQGADRARVVNPGAFLVKTVTNLCLNELGSARARREVYVGPWLPEPVLTKDGELGPLETAEQREAVSVAVLVLLERLSPPERAAYVLREAFGYSHREVASLIGTSEANARQLYSRAKAGVGSRPARTVDPARWAELVARFLAAAQSGDMAALESMLASEAVSSADGGGLVSAARNPIRGADRVARYFAGLSSARFSAGLRLELAEANGEPCVLAFAADGALRLVAFFEIAGEKVVHIRLVLNPQKLARAAAQLDRLAALSHMAELPGQKW
ncbi:MAG: RNA polymerase sigma-70 factor [Segniliparus sp.]|uniref:RNA polymerase sigma-70 factor n=1 Tax=Segniliparus sp. TaxID=2804064 RepID=UPI003F32AB8C